MVFSSIPFLYYFLPIVLLCYAIAPAKCKNMVLLLASLVFYAWGEPKLVLLMAVSVVLGYVFGLLIEKHRGTIHAKYYMIASIVISVGFLGYFKYADFFIVNINMATGLSLPLLKVALPIGISFYTFQLISYIIDVYRGTAAQHSLLNLATYIAMFPQLIAGPIVRYTDIAKDLTERVHRFEDIAYGIRRFVIGLSKKVLIANQLGELCDIFQSSGEQSVLFFWMYAISVSLQIYFDFSGYSDMAIGLGRLFGFKFMENFNYPYISKSVTEFWRRWHISLGSWFRDYIYIPLGGNRVSKGRHLFNIFVVWFLTGFWHGAAWNFIVWGLYFAVLLVIEKFFMLKYMERMPKVLVHGYVLLASVISFVIFDAANMASAFAYIGAMFGFGGLPLVSVETLYYLRSYAILLILALIGATPLVKSIVNRIMTAQWTESTLGTVLSTALELLVLIVLFVVSTAYLVDGSFNPFLYFRF
ncbi:MAG: MBOAT family protein [Peptococcaceae bacterium]|nr:MBOAT family protein [Peptococcaceae bacterium]